MKSLKNLLLFIKEPLGVVLLLMIIQSFCVMHINIPSPSMVPTINVGDHLIISHIPMYYRDPRVGEIIVFVEDETQMIKRVIAGPGQEIDFIDGFVYVDGVKQIEESYVALEGVSRPYDYASEPITYPYLVPEDHYFMMGDNRLSSQDSRYFGPIHRSQIVAVAGIRIYPFDVLGQVK